MLWKGLVLLIDRKAVLKHLSRTEPQAVRSILDRGCKTDYKAKRRTKLSVIVLKSKKMLELFWKIC